MNAHSSANLPALNILLRQPLTQSSEREAHIVARCVSEIESLDGHFARLNFLGGARAQSNDSFRNNFEETVGVPFTAQSFRKYRLSLLRNADALINIRTAMSESTAFEVAYNLFGGGNIPMFFAIWRNAQIRTTLIRDLDDLGTIQYCEFDKPQELRRPLWSFLERIAQPGEMQSAKVPGEPVPAPAPVTRLHDPVRAESPQKSRHTAVLVLENGTVFHGQGIGVEGKVSGELCFNTAMTGYQEILSDPSYSGQIVTFSFPHIGNTGVNAEDMEADVPLARGCVLRDAIASHSSHRASDSLSNWIEEHGMIGISGVDTRQITQLLRENGAQNCTIAHSGDGSFDIDALVSETAQLGGLIGEDLAIGAASKTVSEEKGRKMSATDTRNPRVVVIDYGVKGNIVDCLTKRGFDTVVVPADMSSKEILSYEPDGILMSNGPGDPLAVAPYTVPTVERLLGAKLPVFGICLGHQLLALALGGKVSKMHFGHHGANHPILDRTGENVVITSQNHGFVVDRDSLPEDAVVTHVSLFDGTLAGFEVPQKQVLSVQFHPESSPGPHDAEYLFDRFAEMVTARPGAGAGEKQVA